MRRHISVWTSQRYYIPVVVVAAALTYLIGGNATAAVATVLVACSCAIAMATPVTVLAAVGSSAPPLPSPCARPPEIGRAHV